MTFITFNALRERGIPYTREHLARLVKAGTFPAPVRLGERRIGWVADEVDAWAAERIAQRDAGIQKRAA